MTFSGLASKMKTKPMYYKRGRFMFIDKDQLLKTLNKLYQEHSSCCISLYSYPGQGKSRLLAEFMKEKTCLYFKASCVPWQENFSMLKEQCSRSLGKSFSSCQKASQLLKALKKEASKEPLTVILDDFQYLSAQNRRFFSQLAALEKDSSGLFFILCKPSVLWEKEAHKDSLCLGLRNFNFFETRQLYPQLSPKDQLLLYSITGGNPGILEYFSQGLPVQESLEHLYFQEKGILYRWVPLLLGRYYGNSPFITGILAAIGGAPRHLQEICDKTGLTPSAAGSLLGSLESHGFTEKLVPVTEDLSSRRALYRISNSPFRFWFTFVYPFQTEIEMGRGREVFQKQVLPHLSSSMENAFEDICREFLRLEQSRGHGPFPMEHVGMWWGQHPTKKRTEYISIAASGEKQILLGACFLTEEWLDIDALSVLQKQAGLFPEREKWYYLFSTSDFVAGFEAISGSHVRAFSLEEMCRIIDSL